MSYVSKLQIASGTYDIKDAEGRTLINNKQVRSLYDYGITAGESDSTVKFQAAINECAANGYILIVPKGTFNVSSLYAVNDLHLMGAAGYDSVIHFLTGSFTGDPTNNNRFDHGIIENLRITGTSNITDQDGFYMVMIRSVIRHCYAYKFTGVGFKMPAPDSSYYQTYVNEGEMHGLFYCNAVQCGRGFSLLTWDGMYDHLIASRCNMGIEAYSCHLSNVHIWGFNMNGLTLEGNTLCSNIELEAAIVPAPNVCAISGARNNIQGFNIWNVRVSNTMIWCNDADDLVIIGLSIGPAGDLNPTVDATAVSVIGGTASHARIDGNIDKSFTSGGGNNLSGDVIVNLLSGNSAIGRTIQSDWSSHFTPVKWAA